MTKFKQICTGQYKNGDKWGFVVVALGEDGKVYQYRHITGWEIVGQEASPKQSRRSTPRTYIPRDEDTPF